MRWSYFLLALSPVTRALNTPTSSHANDSSVADPREESLTPEDAAIYNESHLLLRNTEEHPSNTEELGTKLDALANTNATDFPFPRKGLKRMHQVGYGLQWKKGLQNWVAFPLVGLLGCKKYQTLGRMGVGKKHGSCQKAFQIYGKWHQLDGCNPTTGVPKYLLDEEGTVIASCKPKRSKLMCLQEGKIYVRGTCEGPPPQDEDDDDDDTMGGLDSEDEWYN